MSDTPEDFSMILKDLTRNDDAMDFSDYCVTQLNKKKERLLRNTFSGREPQPLRLAPQLTSSYGRLGYYVDKEGNHNGVPIKQI